jgi:phosphinothricin acetyltransferase
MRVRKLTDSDIPRVAEIYNYFVRETTITFEEQEVSEQEMLRRISGISEGYPFLCRSCPELTSTA